MEFLCATLGESWHGQNEILLSILLQCFAGMSPFVFMAGTKILLSYAAVEGNDSVFDGYVDKKLLFCYFDGATHFSEDKRK